jgi:hypothetical protein
MAEYTLAQMIEKLGRNPNLKFKYVGEETHMKKFGAFIHVNEEGKIVNEINDPILSKFTLNSKFSLVNEPVDVMAAFKAFHKGRLIYCEYAGAKFYYDPSSEYGDCALADVKGGAISVGEILYGKWFIEEEEK